MTETDYAKAWGDWLANELSERTWRQADLVRESGGLIKRDRASKWASGSERPSYRLAVVAANTLGVTHERALEAAGYIEPLPEYPEHMAREDEERRAYLQTPAGQKTLEAEFSNHELGEALKNFTEDESYRSVILQNIPDAEILAEIARRFAVAGSATKETGADHALD